mmetsp:Transcript_43109/g.100472  ORF Transcript_43109/g.100472 Transcript_43109/m.100472 type:complete len:189 (+) Transcript_43109:1-567(+)
MMAVLIFMLILSATALCRRKALGSAQESPVMNLGPVVGSEQLIECLQTIGRSPKFQSLGVPEVRAEVTRALNGLCVYDTHQISIALLLFITELEMLPMRGSLNTGAAAALSATLGRGRIAAGLSPPKPKLVSDETSSEGMANVEPDSDKSDGDDNYESHQLETPEEDSDKHTLESTVDSEVWFWEERV